MLPQLTRQKVMLILSGAVIFMVLPAAWFIWTAFSPGQAMPVRWINLLFAALLLFLPVSAAWILLRRKWRTGHWMPSPEERMQQLAKYAAKHPQFHASWLKPVLTPIWLAIIALWITREIYPRPQHAQHGWLHLPMDLWLLMAALNLWLLYRTPGSKATPKP
jgi:hypothetical protein